MAILVEFTDNTCDFVPNRDLDDLIATKSIVAFRRSSGWVDISKDPIRRETCPKRFLGPERRLGNMVELSESQPEAGILPRLLRRVLFLS